jgi:hypothetical protein
MGPDQLDDINYLHRRKKVSIYFKFVSKNLDYLQSFQRIDYSSSTSIKLE